MKKIPFAKPIYVSWLDNQYKKAFWLEFLSKKLVDSLNADCFWIPSGCNHFPGRWNLPVISTFHDLGEYHIANKYSKARMFFRKRICIPLNLKRANRFTSVSEFTKKDMVKFLGLKESDIQVVYNGALPHTLKVPNNSQDILAKLGLKSKSYFFTPGRTDYIGKGLYVLLVAFRLFSMENPDVSLILVGPQGEGHDLLMEDIQKGKSDNAIRYMGRVDDDTIASLYAHSLATVISSRFEGFGFPVLEAMQYQTPIICSNAGSLEEIAGDAAIIFESGNSQDLISKMKMVANLDSQCSKDLKQKGIERLSCFSWQKCSKQMISVFESVSS